MQDKWRELSPEEKYEAYKEHMNWFSKCEFCNFPVLSHELEKQICRRWGYRTVGCNGYQYMQPDPFQEEIRNDHSLYLLCDGEAYHNGQEI